MSRFEPSRANGESLRQAMDEALWSSVAAMLGGMDQSPDPAPRATPLDYGAYSDLVLNIPPWQPFSDDIRAEAEAHLRRRLAEAPDDRVRKASVPRIRNLAGSDYSPIQLARLSRWFTTEESNDLGLAPAGASELERTGNHILRALEHMEKADPEFFGEIAALIDDIIVVTPDRSQRFQFTAGSSFAVWGAIVANSEMLRDWTETYNMLAHEAGHVLLFAIARDEPLVLNSNDAVFRSPVRDDRRPMDGIYHAAFVASREARALDRLLTWHGKTGALSPEDEALVVESLESSVIVFWQAVEALEKDALLSGLGRSLLDECIDFMSRHFALVTE